MLSLRSARFVFSSSSLKRCFCDLKPKKELANQTRGPITFLSLAAAAAVFGGLLFYYENEKDKTIRKVTREVVTVGKAALGGPWVLVDQDGVPKTDASYRGKFCLLYFGFTYCPDICPSELVKIGQIIRGLEKAGENGLQPLFISVDPTRDTVGQLKNYAQDFHPNIVYLTGTSEQVAKATRSFRVYFSKANENEKDEDDYLVDHSIVLYLISPEGEFLEFFTQKTQVTDIVSKILSHTSLKKTKA